MPVYGDKTSLQKALEQAMREAREVVICGVAPRPLVSAMESIVKDMRQEGRDFPWDHLHYITPVSAMILASRADVRLGGVVQQWQSALDGIRNCARQDEDRPIERISVGPHQALRLSATSELYLGTLMLIVQRDTSQRRMWASVGPSQSRDEIVFLAVDERDKLFDLLENCVHRLEASSRQLAIRQAECALLSPEEVERLCADVEASDQGTDPQLLTLTGLQAYGTQAFEGPSCLPVAIVVARSAAAGDQIVLLKKRTKFTDSDSFGRLSLLSSRLLEEDVAEALRVPTFTDRDVQHAMDAMWKARGAEAHLTVPTGAFVRAAQRETFICCGLDLPANRFRFCGYQVLPTEGGGQLCFADFEVILSRRTDPDELILAEAWNPENLVQVGEALLYSGLYRGRLNRLLSHREDWLRSVVFSRPVDALH
jgi:hypothetical protein